jgi:hypothetical protein
LDFGLWNFVYSILRPLATSFTKEDSFLTTPALFQGLSPFLKGGTKACLLFAVQAGGILFSFCDLYIDSWNFVYSIPLASPLARGDLLRTAPVLPCLLSSDFRLLSFPFYQFDSEKSF